MGTTTSTNPDPKTATPPADAGAGAATPDPTAATATPPADPSGAREDYKDRFESQQKVNRDLERKLKEAREAADKAAELEKELASLQGKEAEYEAAQKEKAVHEEALSKANDRILRAEIRALAAGKLTDPADALLHLDLTKFEVSPDGEVDKTAIEAAITNLTTSKPYLAAQGGRFQGGADGGARNGSGPSIDDQIAEATKAGNHRLAIALKRQKAYATTT